MRHKENNLIFEAYKTVTEGKYSPEELKKIAARSAPKDKLNKMDFVPIKEDDYEVDFELGNEIPSIDKGEYDQEGDMAKDQLHSIEKAAECLTSILSDDENLPEWIQSKITLAQDYLDSARDYMMSQKGDSDDEDESDDSEEDSDDSAEAENIF
jgi:hypothetical protein